MKIACQISQNSNNCTKQTALGINKRKTRQYSAETEVSAEITLYAMCAMPYGRFKTKVRRHDRLFAGSAGCSEILKARAPQVLLGAPSGIGLI